MKRYAKIENCIFTYATSQNDRVKYSADLRTSKVMLGQRDNKSPYIYICAEPLKSNAEAIRIGFDKDQEFA